jgi:hypothetical protein
VAEGEVAGGLLLLKGNGKDLYHANQSADVRKEEK